MSLKKAHKLHSKVFNPTSIEKVSVKLALSIFSESTANALKYYIENEGRIEWTGTAWFIELVIKL